MTDVLALSAHLPEIELGPGEDIIRKGDRRGAVWILVAGTVRVIRDDQPVNSISEPGAMFGNVSALLGTPPGATVRTAVPCTLRYAADGEAFLQSNPAITRVVADSLAKRLDSAASHLAGLRARHADTPGRTMVAETLARLT